MKMITATALRAPRIVLGIWLALVLGAALFAAQLDAALSGGGFTNPRAEALLTQKVLERAFGDAPNQFAIVLDSETSLPKHLLVDTETLLTDAGASSIMTPKTNPGWLSAEGTTALIVAGFSGDNTAAQNRVPDLQKKLSALVGTGVSAYVTGQAALDYQLNIHSKEDATRAEMIVFPLLIVVLFLVFRSVVATLLPLMMAGSSLAIANGIGFLTTQVTEISNLYSNIVSMIGLAVAVDYSLFIIKRFREELDQGKESLAAIRATMATAGHSVIFSGIAVILALAALFVPNVMVFTSIALGGIIVTFAALLISMTVLPAALLLLGPNIDRGTLPWLRRKNTHLAPQSRPFTRHPGLVSAVGIALMIAATIPILGLSLQSPVASATILPGNDPARIGLETMTKKIGSEGLFPIQVVLTAPPGATVSDTLRAVQQATAFADNEAGVAKVTSVTTTGAPNEQLHAALSSGAIPQSLRPLWAIDGASVVTRLLIETSDGPDSVRAHELVGTLRTALPPTLNGSVTVAVTGATAQGADFDQTLIRSIPLIAGLVFLLTFLMLMVAFRSAILPLLALFFNTLVVGASLGLLTLLQKTISDVPLNSVTPVLLFAVMFGLSMDYMVIIIARITEAYRDGKDFYHAIQTGTAQTRNMINSAALIMITVFLAFMTGQISIVREIGIGLALAVAFDALLIRMVIMPAVLRTLGPRVFGRRSPRPLPSLTPPQE
ncbi:MAG: hypothetical protein B5766_08365 [Candidatus Lumbricidophila eiseniae]|uniref:SSD domain-containing protein n=1 Tax=Candidatus Lumbricidiphila eiseniae TaxID=1969409 RepID=A0A2A6FQ41_9MICO|nr:MAG: hypothetical protein B5766_08365 [Candidatus Lumbricidophila eiseniae]